MTVDSALASAAMAAAGDTIVTTDSHGYVTSWNHAAELLGISAEQAIGQALGLLIIPEALRARQGACFCAAMSGGHLTHGGQPARVEAVTPDGDVLPLAITLGLLAGPDGAPAGAVAVLRRADASLVPFGTPHGEVIAGLAITPVPGSGEPERVTTARSAAWAFDGYSPRSADALYCAERAVVPLSPKLLADSSSPPLTFQGSVGAIRLV